MPAPNEVTPAPSRACKPAIRSMLVSTLPRAPERMSAASGIVAAQDVGEPIPKAFHEREAIEDAGVRWRYRRLDQIVDLQVDGYAERIELVGGPVEAAPPSKWSSPSEPTMMSSPPSAIEFVEAAAADEDVVADDVVELDRIEIVAGAPSWVPISIQSLPSLPSVGKLVLAPRMKSLPWPPKVSETSSPVMMKSLAVAADDQVEAVAAVDDVVAFVALEDVVATQVRDDVVAGAAFDLVDAVAAFDPVVAAIAPERVVADARDHDVVAAGIGGVAGIGAAEDDVVLAGVAEVIGVGAGVAGLSRMTSGVRAVPPRGSDVLRDVVGALVN